MAAPLWPVVDADALLASVVGLLAARPDLAQKLLDLGRRDKAPDEVPALYDHLFEVAPRSTDRTECNLAAIRPRSAEQIDLAVGTLNRNEVVRGGHKITPEMVAAGVDAFGGYDRFYDTVEEIVIGVFSAMIAVHPNSDISGKTPQGGH